MLADSAPAGAMDESIARRLSTYLKMEVPVSTAAVVRLNIFAAKGLVPPCAVASVLRTICNAWTTTVRFSGPTAVCPFGCGARESDKFFHFPSCPSLRDMWNGVCPGASLIFRVS